MSPVLFFQARPITIQNRTLEGFDEPFERFIEPDATGAYSNSVIVLNGRNTISVGERFAIGTKVLDQLTIVGDTTANTQRFVFGREMLNAWKYTLTFEKCMDSNGRNYGGIGIDPDIYIDPNEVCMGNGDEIIEQAIRLIDFILRLIIVV